MVKANKHKPYCSSALYKIIQTKYNVFCSCLWYQINFSYCACFNCFYHIAEEAHVRFSAGAIKG